MPAAFATLEQEYLFAHSSIREIVYAGCTATERAAMHDMACAVYEKLPGGQTTILREIARHGAESARAKSQADARRKEDILDSTELRFLRAGAEVADRDFQVQEAGRLWQQVARHRLTPPNEQRLALRRAAEALRHAGRLEDARQCLLQARQTPSQPEDTARIGMAMGVTLRSLGEHEAALAEIMAVLSGEIPGALRAEALGCLGGLYRDKGRTKEAAATYEEALILLRQLNDPMAEAKGAGALATLYAQTGRPDAAEALYRRAMQIHSQGGDPRGEAIYAGNLATALRDLGRHEEAEAQCRRALETHRALGNRGDEALCHGNLAILWKAAGRTQEAELAYRRALHLFREQGNTPLEGQYLINLGNLLDDTGRTVQAVDCYEHALSLLRRADLRRPMAFAKGNLAVARQKLGLIEEALGSYSEAIAELQQTGIAGAAAAFMCLRGELLLLIGDDQGAQRDLEAAESNLVASAQRALRLQHWVPLKVRVLAHHMQVEEAYALVREVQRGTGRITPHSDLGKTLQTAEGILKAAVAGKLVNGHRPDDLTPALRKVLAARMPAFRP
ncbi:MAG: tetratricopeptide repeat protein [Planctomycetes bacterium]|nr:tetratricopeptide repeat protein [Planctomycetota bacterium]